MSNPWYKFCLSLLNVKTTRYTTVCELCISVQECWFGEIYVCMYTAVESTLLEITKRSYNFCGNFTKLQNDEIYHILRTSQLTQRKECWFGEIYIQYCSNCKFKYLGQCITADGRCDVEVKFRIEIARKTFIKLKDVLTSRRINLKLRKRLVQCYVLSTFLYASETWTLNKDLENRINAFELWIYRRMLKISYVDRITNEQVLNMVDEKEKLLLEIQTRKLKYFGHLIQLTESRESCWKDTLKGREGEEEREGIG